MTKRGAGVFARAVSGQTPRGHSRSNVHTGTDATELSSSSREAKQHTCGFTFIPAAFWLGDQEKGDKKCSSDHGDILEWRRYVRLRRDLT